MKTKTKEYPNRQAERRARAYWLDREYNEDTTTPLRLADVLHETPTSEMSTYD